MATGDIRNNLKKLQKEVTSIHYPNDIDYEGLTKGDVSAYLPLLYHAFFNFSPHVVENIAKLSYNIAGKKDTDFMNEVFKIMRELNPSYRVTLKIKQFMSKGYAEHKIILTMNIIKFIRTCPKLMKSGNKSKVKNRTEGDSSASSNQNTLLSTNSTLPRPDLDSYSTLSTASNLHSTGHSAIESDYAAHSTMTRSFSASASCPGASTSTQPSVVRHVPPVAKELLTPLKEKMDEEDEKIQDDDIYTLVLGVSDDVVNIKQEMEKKNKELEKENQELKSRMELLIKDWERENQELKLKVESLENETSELRKAMEELKSIQQPQVDINTIVARLDIFDNKLKSIENMEKVQENQPLHSPVCGNNLCRDLKNLHLPADEDSLHDFSQVNDNSLLDMSNESPCRQQIRQRGMKVLEMVQVTKSLLGINSDSAVKLAPEKLDGTENRPPESQENS